MASAKANYRARRPFEKQGYSLAETLVATAVMLNVLLAIYMIFETGQQDYVRGTARADAQQNVRVALESIAWELRTAGYNPSTSGCTTPPAGAVTTLSSDPVSVTFQADVDADNCTNQVTYTYVPPTNVTKPCDSRDPATIGRITRSVQSWNGTAWSPPAPSAFDIAQCVTALMMTYYDSSGATTTSPANVRRIAISITGEGNVPGVGARTYTLASDVRLRNP